MAALKKETNGWVSDERLWLTVDGKLVLDGDRRAAQLLCNKGDTLSHALVKRLKLEAARVEPLEKPTAVVIDGYGGVLSKTKTASPQPPPPPTVSTEAIESRQTRPEEGNRCR